MTIKNRMLLIIVVLMLALILPACIKSSDKSSETSQTAEATETKPPPTTSVEVTPVKNEPQIPDGLGFDVDWSRPLEIIASQENVIIVGNGNIHVMEGYVPGSYTDYYPQVGSFSLCGIGRYKVDNLPTIQYSVDRSTVGLKMLEEWRYQSYADPGKLILYDGTKETVVAQDVLSFSLSADGQRVAYLSQNEASGAGDSLYIFDVATGESALLSESAGPSYILSMTGQSIVFSEYSDGWNGSSFVEHGVVKRMHTDVEQQEVLPKSGQPDNRGIRFWSPLVFLWLKRKSAKSHIS